jgi:RNA-directed DNA polymerase
VRSLRAGERVLKRIPWFITRRLKLVVNDAKSAVARPWERKLLGFRVTRHRAPTRRIAPQAVKRFKTRMRTLTPRTRGRRLETLGAQVHSDLRGWQGYFGFCQTSSVFGACDAWLRRRLRSSVWKPWGRPGDGE